MGLRETVSWYQKKIGAYDKQKWEKTVEQRILHGLMPVMMKNTEIKTDFIDVDLVRGSSFPKAKPKHGFLTVTRLGTLRVIFLPLYAKWWAKQTSPHIFALILVLYLLQLVNTAIYVYNTSHLPENYSQPIPPSEILVPIVMMLILSIIHSQIVSTTPVDSEKRMSYLKSRKSKQRRRKYRQRPASCDSKTSQELETTCRKYQSTSETNNNVNGGGKHVKIITNDSAVKKPKTNKSPETLENVLFVAKPSIRIENVENGVKKLSRSELNESKDGMDLCEEWVEQISHSDSCVRRRRRSAPDYRKVFETESDSDNNNKLLFTPLRRRDSLRDCSHENKREGPFYDFLKLSNSRRAGVVESSICDSEEGECETVSSPENVQNCCPLLNEATTSTTEWMDVTSNSEDCTYSSDYDDETNSHSELNSVDPTFRWDYDLSPAVILSPGCASSDRVSCTIWRRRDVKRAELTALDISSAIIERVEGMPETLDYFYAGILLSILLSLIPSLSRLFNALIEANSTAESQISISEFPFLIYELSTKSMYGLINFAWGSQIWERTVMFIAIVERCILGILFFFLLAVAERTFKQRFLYAKLFSHLTSSRRARKSNLPHFRLNKVRNIKTWLSLRAYLKKRGPQRSVDMIVSAAFIITLLLLAFICAELLRDSVALHTQYNMEVMCWSVAIGCFLLRFMTLGTKINGKFRNLSVLITEQINLYLQIEQKSENKDELMVANNVLKLAADLLKELESPFKISGLSANPYLYTITKLVILSALSGALSEILGFKLKLHKIKIK